MKATIQKLLSDAGIKTTGLSVLGRFVHVDCAESHNDRLQHIFTAAGFAVLKAKNMHHLDGYNGYRISAKLVAA